VRCTMAEGTGRPPWRRYRALSTTSSNEDTDSRQWPAHREDTGADHAAAGIERVGLAHIEGAFDRRARAEGRGILFLWPSISPRYARWYTALAVIQKVQARHRRFDPAWRPPVTVLIAAFNEEKVIRKTVSRSWERLRRPGSDVVDDGSRDRTLAVLEEAFGTSRGAHSVAGECGKSAALNRPSGGPHEILWR